MAAQLGAGDRVLILGLGDTARGDEGAGVRVVEELARAYVLPPNLRTLTAFAVDFDVLDALEETAFVVAVDCVYSGETERVVLEVPLEEFARPAEPPESVHEEALLTALGAMELLRERPEGLLLMIPIAGGSRGAGLSPTVAAKVPAVAEAVVGELAKRGLSLGRRHVG